jgi:hypothetical protein
MVLKSYFETARQRMQGVPILPSQPDRTPPVRTWLDGQTYQCNFTVTRVGITANIFLYIVPPLAHEFIAISGRAINAGGGSDTLTWAKLAGFQGALETVWADLAAGVNSFLAFPQTASNSATVSNIVDTTHPLTRLIAPGQALRVQSTTLDALSNDSIAVIMSLRLFRVGAPPPGTNPFPPTGVSNPSGTVPLNPPFVIFDPSTGNLLDFTFSGATFKSRSGDATNTQPPGVSVDAFKAV